MTSTRWTPSMLLRRRRPEAVLGEEPQVVALVQQLDVDVRVELAEGAHLAVLLRHQVLAQRRQLDVGVDVGQVEVGRERFEDFVAVGAKGEGARLVLPGDAVEVEDAARTLLRSRGRSGRRALSSPPRVQRRCLLVGRHRCISSLKRYPLRRRGSSGAPRDRSLRLILQPATASL